MKNILITGPPGIGKTTIVKSLSHLLKGLDLIGFYTEEIREKGARKGFRLKALDGREGVLAHVDIEGPKIGKYGVNVKGFERFLSSLDLKAQVILIDEIGKMECLSKRFISLVRKLLDSEEVVTVATVAERGRGLIQEVKERKDCEIFKVSYENREALPLEIAERIRTILRDLEGKFRSKDQTPSAYTKTRILLQPIGLKETHILHRLSPFLREAFKREICVGKPLPLPPHTFDPSRGQYHSTTLLKGLASLTPHYERVLGIVDVDLYVPGLNFVFGEADMMSGAAIISLKRLREEFYGLPENEKLFIERAVKEAIHELGHTYGMIHCKDPSCVMYFSNRLEDTDRKRRDFCQICRRRLEGL